MKRWIDIISNTGRSLLNPIFNVLLSIIIIHYSGSYWWGVFVEHLIIIGLALQLINWGNKDYLLREFSKTPAKINTIWLSNVANRSIVLLLFLILLIFYAQSKEEYVTLALWLCLGFLYQSLDVIVVYTKKFNTQIIAEVIGFAVVLIAGWSYNTTYHGLLLEQWFVLGLLIKLITLIVLNAKTILAKGAVHIELNYFLATFPFLAIGLSGMLQSKIDLYVVGWLGEKGSLGTYQVIITLFLYVQAIAGFTLTPFIKQLYRLGEGSIQKLSSKFIYLGLLLCSLALPFIYVMIENVYQFELDWQYYLYGYLFALPIFMYLPKVYTLYKLQKEKKVMYYNFISALINAILTVLLLPNMGIKGALLATALSQWILVLLYAVTTPKMSTHGA